MNPQPPETPSLRASVWRPLPFRDREIAALAGPALFTLAAPPLVALFDVFIAGRLGTGPQAGLAVGVAMLGFLLFSTNFLEYGTTAVVAQRLGAGDVRGARRAGTAAVLAAVVIGVLMSLAVVLGAHWLMTTVMRAEGGTATEGAQYLQMRMLSAAPFLVLRAGNGWFRGRGNTLPPLAVSLVMSSLSVAAAPILAFGWGGVDGLGLRGIAIAAAGAEVLGGAALLLLAWRDAHRLGDAQTGGAGPGWGNALALNRDILLRTLCVTGTFTLAGIAASAVDSSGVTAAAYGIVSSLWLFTALALDSLAIAAQSMVGAAVGSGHGAAARSIAARVSTLETAVGLAAGLVLAVLAVPLVALLSGDEEVRSTALPAVLILAALMPLSAIVFGLDGVFLGAGDGRYLRDSMVAASTPAWLALGAMLAFGGSLTQIWVVIALFVVLRMIFLGRRLTGSAWLSNRL
ncbi:MAG: MATE family efflux transporter [Dehalococcoidia bacterium]